MTMVGAVFGLSCAIGLCVGAFGQTVSDKDRLGRARNLSLDELMKPHDVRTSPSQSPPVAGRPNKDDGGPDLKRSARTIPYAQLAREPTRFVGAVVTMRGKVTQSVQSSRSVMLRINVTPGQHDIWSDTVYVEYTRRSESEPRILENDIVAIWGAFEGIKSYSTVLGATAQIPHVNAAIVERSTGALPTIIQGPGYNRGMSSAPSNR